ncbi:MAG: IS21 family transposase [Chloroflexota bacterium]
MELFERIRRDHREEGLSVRALARRHHVHRRTVRQALASALPPPRARPTRVAPVMGPWTPLIREWLVADRDAPRKQRHTARRIWQRLVEEHDAPVAEPTVRRVVQRLRAELTDRLDEVTIVGHHVPGEEAEVDFGEAMVIVAGEPTRVHLFHLRLSASAKGVTLAFLGEDQAALLEGHVRTFERLGGVPARIRYDNLRAAVVKMLRGRARVEADRFVALRSHYGFDSFFCAPGERGSHEKGGVEGEVGRFRRRHLVPVPKVADLAALDGLLEAADAKDGRRHVDGRRETVGQAFEEERTRLRPLPDEPFDAAIPLRPKVDRKARVCVRQRWYSVPARLVGRRVEVRLGARRLRVLHEGRAMADHERSQRKGSQTLLLDHYLEVLARKPGALASSLTLAQARQRGLFTRAHERFWQRARRRLGDAAGTRALIEVLLLHRRLPFIAVHAALDAVEAIGSADPALVAIEARRIADGRGQTAVTADRAERGGWSRPVPALAGYDALLGTGAAR